MNPASFQLESTRYSIDCGRDKLERESGFFQLGSFRNCIDVRQGELQLESVFFAIGILAEPY